MIPMDGNILRDYPQRLTDIRERYKKNLAGAKKSHQRHLENEKAAAKLRQEKQQQVYLRDKAQLEKELSEFKDRSGEHFGKQLEEEKDRYRKKVASLSDKRGKENALFQKNYSEKLDKISRDYKDSLRGIKGMYEEDKKRSELSAKNHLEKNRSYFNNTLSEIRNKSDREFERVKDQSKAERAVLAKDYEEKKQELVREASLDRDDRQKGFDLSKKRLVEANERENKKLRDTRDSERAKFFREKEREINKIKSDIRDKMVDIADKNKKNANRMKQQRNADVQAFETRLADQEMESRKQLNSIQNQAFQRRKEEIGHLKKTFDNSLAISKKKHDYRNQQNTDFTDRALEKLKKDYKDTVGLYKDRYWQSEVERGRDEIKAEQRTRGRLNTRKKAYAKELAHIQESNRASLSSVRAESAKEQQDILLKADRHFREEREDLRDSLNKGFARREARLQDKLAIQEADNQRIMDFYAIRLDRLQEEMIKEVDFLREIAKEQRVEDRINFRRRLKEKERAFGKSMSLARQYFGRQLDLAQNASKAKIDKITKEHDKLLAKERSAHKKELRSTMRKAKDEQKNILQKMNRERESLIAQYESRIEDLRHLNRADRVS